MRILVLGGGLQGKAVLYDLSKCNEVEEVVCVDINVETLIDFKNLFNLGKIKIKEFDINNKAALLSLMKNADVVIDLLPSKFLSFVTDAAIEAKVNLVNTMYGHQLPDGVHEKALAAGITIMPEAGLDPGIDLILCGYGVSQLDEVNELHSYCGGLPEEKASDNPLQYKISWSWEGTLKSYRRPARILIDGKIINIAPEYLYADKWINSINFPGVGELELIPNGDAIIIAEKLGILDKLKNTTRCSMRRPGHSKLWDMFIKLNFLSDLPVKGISCPLSPFDFMVKHLEPQLGYKNNEKDIVAMRVIIGGVKERKKKTISYDLLDMRDLDSGLLSMNRTVGFTASIVSQMICKGDINRKGLLTAVKDIPYADFLCELSSRGIVISKKVETEIIIGTD